MPSRKLQIAAGASGGAALVGGTAAEGSLELVAGFADRRWQLRIGASSQTARQLEMGGGRVDWQHTSFVAGPVLRTLHPKWRVSLDAGPMLGWATLAGSGFSPSRTQRSFEYGANVGLRLARWFGRFALWCEGRASLWANGQQARANGAGGAVTRDLPMVDAHASLGVSAMLF
jgi:hypothetical protein